MRYQVVFPIKEVQNSALVEADDVDITSEGCLKFYRTEEESKPLIAAFPIWNYFGIAPPVEQQPPIHEQDCSSCSAQSENP